MEQNELLKKVDTLKNKLSRAQRQLAGLKEKSSCLEMQYGDSKEREKHTNELVMELLERQRELNVMLNRANIMLNRTQETMALTSLEFNEMAKALPEPKKAEWSDRVTRINELFKKTGIQDAELTTPDQPSLSDSLDTNELKKESEQVFAKKLSIWDRTENPEPPRVEAEIVPEEEEHHPEPKQSEIKMTADSIEDIEESSEEDNYIFGPQRKSWWQKIAG